jgi:hypothetical protein
LTLCWRTNHFVAFGVDTYTAAITLFVSTLAKRIERISAVTANFVFTFKTDIFIAIMCVIEPNFRNEEERRWYMSAMGTSASPW